jgi:hypothetical protein
MSRAKPEASIAFPYFLTDGGDITSATSIHLHLSSPSSTYELLLPARMLELGVCFIPARD